MKKILFLIVILGSFANAFAQEYQKNTATASFNNNLSTSQTYNTSTQTNVSTYNVSEYSPNYSATYQNQINYSSANVNQASITRHSPNRNNFSSSQSNFYNIKLIDRVFNGYVLSDHLMFKSLKKTFYGKNITEKTTATVLADNIQDKVKDFTYTTGKTEYTSSTNADGGVKNNELTLQQRFSIVYGYPYKPEDTEGFGVYTGSFKNLNYCKKAIALFIKKYKVPVFIVEDISRGLKYHVIVGKFKNYKTIQILEGKIRKDIPKAFIVRWSRYYSEL